MFIRIYRKLMVLILDGSTEHVAPVNCVVIQVMPKKNFA